MKIIPEYELIIPRDLLSTKDVMSSWIIDIVNEAKQKGIILDDSVYIKYYIDDKSDTFRIVLMSKKLPDRHWKSLVGERWSTYYTRSENDPICKWGENNDY